MNDDQNPSDDSDMAAPHNSMMELSREKKPVAISLCHSCSITSKQKTNVVATPAMGLVRINGSLVPVCRLHRGGCALLSFQEVWDEWCIQSVMTM